MAKTNIPALPSRDALIDDNGYITRPWLVALQGLASASVAEEVAPETPVEAPPTVVVSDPTAPVQPASGDWTLALIEYGYGDPTGQHGDAVPCAHVRATVTTAPADVLYFSAFVYWGASAPVDVSQYLNIGINQPKADTGSTAVDIWIKRPAVSTDLQVVIASSSQSFQSFPTNVTLSAAKSVTINAVGLPAQPTLFVASCAYSVRGGVPCGALAFTWTPPADPEYFSANVYKIDTDASYTPLGGATWALVGNAISGFDQRTLNQWWTLTGIGYCIFKVQSVSRVLDADGHNIETTAAAPTYNLTISATTGLELNSANPLTVGDGLAIAGGKLKAKVASGLTVDGSGNVILGTVQSTNLAAGSLGDLSSYASDKRPIVILTGLPGLPSSSYPAGAIIFNTSDGKLYRNVGGAWSKGSDPQDLIAGTIASGVAYVGRIVVSQLDAGTATFYGDVTFQRSGGGRVVINSGGVQILNPYGYGITLSSGGGVAFTDNTGWTIQIGSHNISGAYNIASVQMEVAGSTGLSYFNAKYGADYRVNGTQVIDPNGSFTGAGVSCTRNGIGGTNYNVYQNGWYYGAAFNTAITFTTADGKTVTVRGGIITSIY